MDEVRWGLVEFGISWARSGQVRLGQVGSGQVRLGWVSKVGLGQIGLGYSSTTILLLVCNCPIISLPLLYC